MAEVAPVDANVTIPAAVKAAAARSAETFKSIYGDQAADGEAAEGTEITTAQDASDQTAQPDQPKEAQKSSEAPLTAEVNQQKTYTKQAPGEDEQSWEHKYKSMKGRYERAESTIRQLTERISSMENVIISLQAAPPPEAQRYGGDDFGGQTVSTQKYLTPEEEADYGSEFLSVVGKKAKEELAPEVVALKKEVDYLKQQMGGIGGYVTQTERQRMQASLDAAMPNWREVNRDPNFLTWLKLPDAYSGAIRHNLLKQAYERNDGPRVLAFFRGFLSEEAAVSPANSGPDVPDGATVQGKVPLNTLAAPGRAKTAAASTAPAEKPYFTRAQIAKFYADSAAGRFRGREAEKDRIEKQIFAAEREGRIK